MKLTTWYNQLTDTQKSVFKTLILILVVGLLSAGLTYYYTNAHWETKYSTLQNEYDVYRVNHPDTGDKLGNEQAVINKALTEKEAKVPVKETIGLEGQTVIGYQPKSTPTDSDVEINSEPTTISVSYNGKQETIPTKSTTEQGVTTDGKVVVNQKQAATIDIDSIVNREIANKVLEDEHKQAVLERQKKQRTFWGVVGGLAVGYLAGQH